MTANRRQVLQGAAAATLLSLDSVAREADSLTLWYRQPAAQWTEALPLGNGRLGAMVFGGITDDRIQINEGTLWGGSPHDYTNPSARIHLARLRELIFSGDMAAAEALTAEMMGNPPLLMPFQPLCDLHLSVDESGTEEYRRALSLEDACATVTYRSGGARFHREIFASHPDQVIAIRLTCDQPGRQNLSVGLVGSQPGGEVAVTADTLSLKGQVQPRANPPRSWTGSWDAPGLRYAAKVRVRAEGGATNAENWRVVVRGADAVTILFSAATSFRDYNDIGGDAEGQAGKALAAAWPKSFDQLRAAHQVDHQALFQRVTLDLGPSVDRPIDQRIADAKRGDDPALAALYFQFGRYLLLSSSRPGGQPANLQGLWNPHLVPPWGSKWTTNINLQMNYWLAEVAGLWETLTPLWDLVGDLQKTGAVTAATHYGAGGWVLHHNTDLWRATTPVDGAWGIWPMGAVWLAHQMWDHYRFSLDRRFLQDRAWPAMHGAVRFVLDTLVEAPAGTPFAGKLVTNPSFSPENSYYLNGKKAQLTYAATMDLQLIGELFGAFVEASKLLERDAAMRSAVVAAQERLPPMQVGRRGQLQEWIEDYAEVEPEHRHVSHLWSLYPGHSITPSANPKLAEAARRTLELRGDGGTGWAKAWKIALWARLLDGDRAHLLLRGQLAESTLPNMLDTHPPFQIDGNFGAAAAIAEMLVQSDDQSVSLLPALPSAWPQGKVAGMRARGGLTVDLEWRAGKLAKARLISDSDRVVTVNCGTRSVSVKLSARWPIGLDENLGAI